MLPLFCPQNIQFIRKRGFHLAWKRLGGGQDNHAAGRALHRGENSPPTAGTNDNGTAVCTRRSHGWRDLHVGRSDPNCRRYLDGRVGAIETGAFYTNGAVFTCYSVRMLSRAGGSLPPACSGVRGNGLASSQEALVINLEVYSWTIKVAV